MNEFAAKKLGEVLAFSNSGVAILERGQEAMKSLLGDKFDETVSSLKTQAEKIKTLSNTLGNSDVTNAKAEKTGAKLIAMAEMYIGEEWGNPTELLEWFGFFEGAAIIHWRLVHGAGEGLNSAELSVLAKENIELHTNLLNTFGDYIHAFAVEKSKA